MSWLEDFIAQNTPVEEDEEEMWIRLEYQAGCHSYEDEE